MSKKLKMAGQISMVLNALKHNHLALLGLKGLNLLQVRCHDITLLTAKIRFLVLFI